MACGVAGCQHGFSTVFPGSLLASVLMVDGVEGGAGAVEGAGYEVSVDLVVTSMLLWPSQRDTSVIGMPSARARQPAPQLGCLTLADPRYAGKASMALLRASGLRVGTIHVGLSLGWIRREKRPSLKLL